MQSDAILSCIQKQELVMASDSWLLISILHRFEKIFAFVHSVDKESGFKWNFDELIFIIHYKNHKKPKLSREFHRNWTIWPLISLKIICWSGRNNENPNAMEAFRMSKLWSISSGITWCSLNGFSIQFLLLFLCSSYFARVAHNAMKKVKHLKYDAWSVTSS